MFKIVYFDGTELELHWKISIKRAITTARKNPEAYQVVRNNGRGDVYWERECPKD